MGEATGGSEGQEEILVIEGVETGWKTTGDSGSKTVTQLDIESIDRFAVFLDMC